ncbi:MerR family transcriptional regulator [Xanthobacter agilis]|jgi:DNA-binding transcriptional MerR regulator|uniref:DNA-binding transcriptional MerR regulator n=1 Tax=Xanthobacter agilis TaxID=47492 RepID=A0ABU0L807_XANAG|nr:MerR family transcriptional regulator [Xanthobacter agilis]MDQ0503286.1 DNA-binding transcriptional MerR regulator [Xanthobacter agilis]
MDATTYDVAHALGHAAAAAPLAPPSSPAEEAFTIGDLAREFGTTLRALRFYEDKGLLSPRRDGMTRLYSATDRERLTVILKGKQLGFTLAEIRALVAAKTGTPAAESGAANGLALTRERCLKQLAQLERQRGEIDSAIEELKGIAETLAA